MEWLKALSTPFLFKEVEKSRRNKSQMNKKEPSQDIDDILIDEESADFDADDIDNELFDGEDLLIVDNSSDINNIFSFQHNLHEKLNKIVLKQPIHGFREVSLSFSLFNINRILKITNVAYKDVSSMQCME